MGLWGDFKEWDESNTQKYFGGSNAPGITQVSGWSPEQTQLAQQLFPMFMQQFQEGGLFSGKPAYEINPEITREFFQKSIYDPTMRELNEVTLPSLREGYTNLWSSARLNAENQARMGTQNQPT